MYERRGWRRQGDNRHSGEVPDWLVDTTCPCYESYCKELRLVWTWFGSFFSSFFRFCLFHSCERCLVCFGGWRACCWWDFPPSLVLFVPFGHCLSHLQVGATIFSILSRAWGIVFFTLFFGVPGVQVLFLRGACFSFFLFLSRSIFFRSLSFC